MGGATRTANTPGGASTAAADLLTVGDGYLQASPNADALEELVALTISGWINLQADPGSDGSGNNRIAALQAATASFDGFSLNTNSPASDPEDVYSADDFRLGMFIGGENEFGFGQSTADIEGLGGEWIFVSTTYDGSDGFAAEQNLAFYTGTETASVSQLGDKIDVIAGALFMANVNFYVGKTDAAPSANTSMEGFVDDIRIYDRALSLEELEAVRLENLEGGGGLEADFDKDGDVDGDDFLIWQSNFPTLDGSATANTGDANNDMNVDGDDFLVWQNQFGSSEGGGSSAIPEPSSLVLLLAAVATWAGLRR